MSHQTTVIDLFRHRLKELDAFATWLWGAGYAPQLAHEAGVSIASVKHGLRSTALRQVSLEVVQAIETALRARGFVSALDFTEIKTIRLARRTGVERVPAVRRRIKRAACFLVPERVVTPPGLAYFDFANAT